ncbi:MAG TPA: threonine/serine dehydratase [Anaerolineales bacterium]|nr:threonine/serine dehydratase [Anaerolineales bacterium]
MFPPSWFQSAAKNIYPYILQTPLTYDADLDLYLKWENQQITGSFKARGAFNKVLNLHEWERQRGLVTASAGNHGQGLALAGKTLNSPVTIFTSEHAARNKLDAMQALGATLITVKGGYAEAEIAGLSYAEENEATWVSPYNDGLVIAGQGTIGLEILQQAPEMSDSTWLVPVGGGGLISGVALAVKDNPDLRKKTAPFIIGVQSEASAFMHALFYQNTQKGVVEYPSLADGLEGAVENRSVTIHLVRRFVDEIILVDEEEIAKAIKFAWQKYHQKIEGSAAVTLAAVISGKITQRPVLAIITGGNIDLHLHQELISDKV